MRRVVFLTSLALLAACVANDRQDAPLGSDFDTYESYLEFQIDVYNRSAANNDQMPPAGDPSAEERAMLGEWIACGSPQ